MLWWNNRHAAGALDDFLHFEDIKEGFDDFAILGDQLEGFANDLGAFGGGFGEFDGGFAFGGAADDADLIGAILFDRAGDLAETVDDFFLDLADHSRVAKVDFADVDAPEFVAPLVGFWGDLGANGHGHGVAGFQHGTEGHIA